MFGLIGHLTSLEHAQSVANELGYPEYGDQGLDFWCSAPPHIVDQITVTSITGQKIEGRYVETCFLPEMIATRRIKAAPKLGIELSKATVAVCGATGDIGSAVCRWLNVKTNVAELLLIARDKERLQDLQSELGRGKIMDLEEALPQADIVVWVASMPKGVEIDPKTLKQPCLLNDCGYPKNLATQVQHPEIYVLNGGIVEHSLDIEWKIMKIVNMDVPGRQLFACFAESMLLEFEKMYTNFSWGRNQITVEKMEQIGLISVKHGFRPLLMSF